MKIYKTVCFGNGDAQEYTIIMSEAIAGLPLHLYRYKDGGGKEKAVDHPLYLLLHDEPNP